MPTAEELEKSFNEWSLTDCKLAMLLTLLDSHKNLQNVKARIEAKQDPSVNTTMLVYGIPDSLNELRKAIFELKRELH